MSKWYERPAPVAQELIVQQHTADLVVVGLGYSGTPAVRAAAEAGLSVIGIEAMAEKPYHCFGRDIGHINSAFLQSRGVPAVDPIDLYNEMLRRAGNRVNPSLIMQFCQNCGTTFDWLTDTWGVDGLDRVKVAFWPEGAEKFKAEPGADFNGYHFWNGTAQFPDTRARQGSPSLVEVMHANHEKARQAGAQLFFSTQAVDLVDEDGRITGVIARQKDGTFLQLNARRAVLLAAGDFSGNVEMMQDLVTDIFDMLPDGKKMGPRLGRKGKGIQMGVWVGGALEPRPLAVMGGNYRVMSGFTTFASLWLDSDGNRFCNEVFGGPELAAFPGNALPAGTCFSIFDENVARDLDWSYPAHGSFDHGDGNMTEWLQQIMENATQYPQGHPDSMKPMAPMAFQPFVADNIYSGATPQELADNAGLTGTVRQNLIDSILRYNRLCRAGRDDDFGKAAKLLRPLEGRLFLQKTQSDGSNLGVTLVTVGGLLTDANQNVLDRNYQRIPGLYATGNCCGRRFGAQYTTPISGISIGMATTLGRQAGLHIATL